MMERQVVTSTMIKSIASSQTVQKSAVLQDELELIVAAQDGDVFSFNELVHRYQTPVYHTAFRMLGSAQAAEDAAQDAFVSAYRYIHSFRGGSLKAWLIRFVTNACYDRFRQSECQLSMPYDELPLHAENFSTPSESPQDFAERWELGNLIQRGLTSMPADERMTLVLADIDELSYEEIAEITQVNMGTVRSRLARARALLREFLLIQNNMVP